MLEDDLCLHEDGEAGILLSMLSKACIELNRQ